MTDFSKYALPVCLGGSFIVLGGELLGALDKSPGNTISEWFVRQPIWLQLFIAFMVGFICCHLFGWYIADRMRVELGEVNGDVNIEVTESES